MPAVLFIAFIVVPIVELFLAIEVAQVIGGWWTILLLIAISVIGATVVRREGLAAWGRFRTAVAQGRLPTSEVVDGALVILGGALLLTPGFLSDLFGLFLVLPPTRALLNRLVRGRVRTSFLDGGSPFGRTGLGPPGPRPRGRATGRDDDVVDIEVVSVEREDPPRP